VAKVPRNAMALVIWYNALDGKELSRFLDNIAAIKRAGFERTNLTLVSLADTANQKMGVKPRKVGHRMEEIEVLVGREMAIGK